MKKKAEFDEQTNEKNSNYLKNIVNEPNILPNYSLGMNIGLDAFPFMASFLPPTYYFTLFIIYFLEGRMSGYIPTISETGTEEPNNSFMICFFCSIAASIFYLMSSITFYITSFYQPNLFERFLLKSITFVSSISYIFISIFPMNTHPSQHFSSVFSAFFGIILFQIIVLIITRHDYSTFLSILRGIFIVLQIAPLILCAVSSKFFNHRINVTIQAISEYSIVVFLPFFFMSYSNDLSNLELILSF
ncbi:hypothetical protein M9Y10_008579 [Tritrichomonas musculus]|uniref:CWH43-like N-terminal domain-containing protein n=1 Tax=Tritrichomonas musculus TaxID=1915356 RepID=A0ABR2IZ95_9EUKA